MKLQATFLLILTFSIFAFSFVFIGSAFAQPSCQVLDKVGSKLDITLDLFGEIKKTKIDRVKAFLWIDAEKPESANMVASLEPRVSQLFGNFEQNPLLMGMMANYLDKELTFKSRSVVKTMEKDLYKVLGDVTSGQKKYPVDFNVSLQQVGKEQSRFATKVESDNFEKIIGAPGSAKGDFDLLFRTNKSISKELCAL